MTRISYPKCLYYSFQIFGVATLPYDVITHSTKNAKSLTFKYSKCGIFYNLLLIVLILTLYYFALKVVNAQYSDSERKQFDMIIHNLHNLSAGLACLPILLYFCVTQKKTTEIVKKLRSINETVLEIGYKNSSNLHEKFLRETTIIFLWNFLSWLPAGATIKTWSFEICLSFIYKQLCHLIIAFTLMQYSIVLAAMRVTLGAIDENLRCFLKNGLSLDRTSSATSFTQFKLTNFWRLSEMYLSLCDVSDEVSHFYSLPILLSISYIFITFIFLSHYILKPIIIIGVTAPIKEVMHCTFRILQFLVSLIILTKLATATVQKSKNIGKTINEHLGLKESRSVDVKVYYFANYLLQRTCQFTVFGLFSIDVSILMSIVGSIATYLVICLQFQQSDSD